MKARAFLSTVSMLAVFVPVAHGDIVSVFGAGEVIAAPGDARLNVVTSNTHIRAWNEAQSFTLDRAVRVDASAAGFYDSKSDLNPSTILAGTIVSSHYVHFDSVGSAAAKAKATLTFDADILGVIVTGDESRTLNGPLDMSDFLGSSTVYPDKQANRGLELGKSDDRFEISADLRSITFDLRVSSPGDFARVITIPSPGATVLVCVAGVMAWGRRRQSVPRMRRAG